MLQVVLGEAVSQCEKIITGYTHLRLCETAAYRHDTGRENALLHDRAKQVLHIRRETERHRIGGGEVWGVRGKACMTHALSSAHTHK